MHQSRPQPQRPLGFTFNLDEMEHWHANLGEIREVIQKYRIVGTGGIEGLPPEARRFATSYRDVELVSEWCFEAVRTGRLFDFGAWTNDVIIYGGNRGGPLYSKGLIGLPFRDPWLFVHRWEPVPGRWAASVYLVVPLEPDHPDGGGEVEVVELDTIRVRAGNLLMISDRAVLYPNNEEDGTKYHCAATPSPWRFLAGMEVMNESQKPGEGSKILKPENAAAGNVLDPLVTALLILSTRGIARETVTVSPKLQKARARNGKPPIPPYERVASSAYVTAITSRKARGRRADGRGTHASPVCHLRLGHPRIYSKTGKTIFVRDALVGGTDEAREQFQRSHYAVR